MKDRNAAAKALRRGRTATSVEAIGRHRSRSARLRSRAPVARRRVVGCSARRPAGRAVPRPVPRCSARLRGRCQRAPSRLSRPSLTWPPKSTARSTSGGSAPSSPSFARRTPVASTGPSSTGPSRPTTRWASTTPGAAPTRTPSSVTTPCSATTSAGRTASIARASGWRSTSSVSWASRARRTSSPSASRTSCDSASSAS